MRSAVLVLVALGLLAATSAAGTVRAAGSAPRVTFVGDSAAVLISLDPVASAILRRGVDVRLEAAVCRRLARTSCPDGAVRHPTVLELIERNGTTLGSTVVIAVGYNDPEEEYAGEIEEIVRALHAVGVEQILWLTLRAARHPYLTMNDAIRDAAARHPSMTVVDWNELSRTHPGWFADDGIHLERDGARAMAALVRRVLGETGVAPPLPELAIATTRLPRARVAAPYAVALLAVGGEPGYRWKRIRGPLPSGLRISTTGRLMGVPRASGRFAVTVKVTDSVGVTALRTFPLSIAR